MTPEAAFFKAWGREPSRAERERLRRLQAAFAIDENDALLTIAMVLEFYDGIFRLYPEKCAVAVRHAIQECLAPVAGRSSPAPATSLQRPTGSESPIHDWVTLGGLTTTFMMLFGAGVVLGAALVSRRQYLASFASPAAWIVAPISLVYVGTWGWARIRNAPSKSNERRVGWIAVTAAGVAMLAWLLLLRVVTSGT